ncbi:probable profilin [Fusarium mangiferae]|uniref:Profilin n=1 Tax=Fusarium mangiferae TaxID=192010 RepID=A0A1L7TTI4_FUSMA|nr:putative profilin [Fusarium mangiferae]CVL00132.1 probable profilin [Fusarium mangiferae]
MSWQGQFLTVSTILHRPAIDFPSPAIVLVPHHRLQIPLSRTYIDSSLVGSGHIDKGAIISAAGDSAWASSPDLQLKPEEMKAISAIVGGDSAAKDKAFAEGLYIAGERYVMARAEDRSIYARSGRLGVAVAKTGQAIVIGHHGEAQVAGNATSTVEGLADYLIKSGY